MEWTIKGNENEGDLQNASSFTGESNLNSTLNSTIQGWVDIGSHEYAVSGMYRLSSEGITVSGVSDQSWIDVVGGMEEREVGWGNFMGYNTALDTQGSGGFMNHYPLSFPQSISQGTPMTTFVQMDIGSDGLEETYYFPSVPNTQTGTYVGTGNAMEPPWSPATPRRMPKYGPDYVAFVNDPESPSEHSSNGELLETFRNSPTAIFPSLQPAEATAHSTQIGPGCFPQQLEWRIVGTPLGISESSNKAATVAPSGQRGRRNGPLPPKVRRAAKCETGFICDKCRKCSPSVPLCIRSLVTWYELCYFPYVLTSHLCQKEVESLIKENVESWTDVEMRVNVTCGGIFHPMELAVKLFINKTDELLYHHRLTTKDESERSEAVIENSALVGLMGMDLEALQVDCTSYIKSMISNKRYVPQVTAGDPTAVCCDVLQEIHSYFLNETQKDPLLDKAMQLHAMHFFMRTSLTFTAESAATLASRSSRLLARQLKYPMHKSHKSLLRNFLKELEIYLKKQDQTLWPVLFCVVIILCLCTEDIQIAVDNFVSHLSHSFDESRQSYSECLELEGLPFARIFHEAFNTRKKPTGHGTKTRFNPILDGVEGQTSWSQNARDLVKSIGEYIHRSYVDLRALSQRSVFENNRFRLDHQGFIDNNPGRLLSKFLISFIE